jgi:putative transcriptional regulator
MKTPAPGKLLIADPFLKDPNFARTVILLCEHQAGGSMGFVINKLSDYTLDELIPDSTHVDAPVFLGGPVQVDTLHFIHALPDMIEDGIEIIPNIYWGGNFEKTMLLMNTGVLHMDKIKFFVGYSGWADGQLQGELNERSWIVSDASSRLVFREKESAIWQASLMDMGNDFAALANYPIDPSLN